MFPAVRAYSPGRHTWAGPAQEPERPWFICYLSVFQPSGHVRPGGAPGTMRRANRTVPSRLRLLSVSSGRPGMFTRAAHLGQPGAGAMPSLQGAAAPSCTFFSFFFSVHGRLRYDAGGASGRTRRTSRLCPFCSHLSRRSGPLSHLAWAAHPGGPGAGTGTALAIVFLSSTRAFPAARGYDAGGASGRDRRMSRDRPGTSPEAAGHITTASRFYPARPGARARTGPCSAFCISFRHRRPTQRRRQLYTCRSGAKTGTALTQQVPPAWAADPVGGSFLCQKFYELL